MDILQNSSLFEWLTNSHQTVKQAVGNQMDQIQNSSLFESTSSTIQTVQQTVGNLDVEPMIQAVQQTVGNQMNQIQNSSLFESLASSPQAIQQIIGDIDFQPLLEALKDGGFGALIGLSIIPCILILLCLMGFCCIGVAVGSFAAVRQSKIGSVPAKSLFSYCQSIAMNRATYYLIPKLGFIGFLVGFISYFI